MKFPTLALIAILCVIVSKAGAQEPAQEAVLSESPAIYQPDPLSQRITAIDVLGTRLGYVHPFLSLGEFYTDNLFNTPAEEESEWVTVLSPGIWISVPASRQPLLDLQTLNTAPGGLGVSRFRIEPERRFQGYGLYRADLRDHREFPEEETDTHRGEGLLYYRLRGGLSFELLDIYQADQDAYGTGTNTRQLDEFNSNLVQLTAAYPISPKLALEGTYGFYTLDYDDDRNRFREREDQTLGAAVSFRFLPKTSLLFNYRFMDIDYEADLQTDSEEHQVLGGVQWVMSPKTSSRILMGVTRRDYDDDQESRNDLSGEARLDYSLSPKTAFNLRAVRQVNESDIEGIRDILRHRVHVGYAQRLSARWSGSVDAYYMNDDYRGTRVGGVQAGREDDYLSAGLTFGYAFRSWLNLSLGYSHVKRDSNFERFDYDTNTIFATVTAAL